MTNEFTTKPASEDGSPRCAEATGSLPVSSAEFLQAASILDRFAAQLERGKFIQLPPQYREIAFTLRAQACRATERQPEENTELSNAGPSASGSKDVASPGVALQ